MDSTDACERRKRLVNALSSRNKPSSRCSVSMYGDPNWLASYLAKKITRLAFSVYRSNIFPSPRCSQSPLPETSRYPSGCELRTHQNEAFLSRQPLRHEGGNIAAPDETYLLPNRQKNLKPVFTRPLIQRRR